MITRWTALVVVLLAWSNPAAAQDKPFVWKEGKCELQFPGTPREDAKQKSLTFAQLDGEGKLVVVYLATFKAEAKLGMIAEPEGKRFLEQARDLLVKSIAGKLLGSKYVKTATHFGVEFQYEAADKGVNRIAFCLAAAGLYHLQVTGDREVVNGKEAEAFFKSFKLLK